MQLWQKKLIVFSAARLNHSLALPTRCATSCKQASNKVREEIMKSRQRFLALMIGGDGEMTRHRTSFLVC